MRAKRMIVKFDRLAEYVFSEYFLVKMSLYFFSVMAVVSAIGIIWNPAHVVTWLICVVISVESHRVYKQLKRAKK